MRRARIGITLILLALVGLNGCSRMDDPKVLVARLATASEKQRTDLIAALSRLKDEAMDEVLEAVDHPDPVMRQAVAQVLGRMRSKEALEGLQPLLKDEEPEVRQAAARALKQLVPVRKKLAVQMLEEQLGDSNPQVVHIAAVTLVDTNHPRASMVVNQMIEGEPSVASTVMARRLYQREGSGAPHLLQALQSDEETVRETAVEQIKVLGPTFVDPLVKAASEAETPRLQEALSALRDHLMDASGKGNPQQRRRAVRALGRIGDQKSLERLVELVEKTGPMESVAARTLGETGTESAKVVETLQSRLKAEDASPQTQLDMAIALAQLGRDEGLDYLLQRLESTEEETEALEEKGAAAAKSQRFTKRVLPTLLGFAGVLGIIISVSVHSRILGKRGEQAGALVWLKLMAIAAVALMLGGFGYLLLGNSIFVIVGGFIGLIIGVWLFSHGQDRATEEGASLKYVGIAVSLICGAVALGGFAWHFARGRGVGAAAAEAGAEGGDKVNRTAMRAKAQKALSEVGDMHREKLLKMYKAGATLESDWMTPEELDARDPLRLWAVVKTLGELREERAVPLMTTLLTAPGGGEKAWRFPNYIRWTAAMALGQMGSKEAMPALRQVLESERLEDETVRYYVEWAVREIEEAHKKA